MVDAGSTNVTTAHQVLRTGNKLPNVGLGLWKMPKDVAADAVYNAIEAGYRLLDGACDYGNEKEVGAGIKRALDAGLCKREDLCILSKLWNTFHQPEHVEEACRKTMADLGVDYLDVYLIHFPIALKYVPHDHRYPPEWIHEPKDENPRMILNETGVTYQQTYQAMEALVEKGLVRDIGCSNIGTTMLRQVMQYAKVKPSVLQVEMHPFCVQALLKRMANENGVQVMAYSNLGAASYVEIGLATEADSCLTPQVVKDLAAKYNKSAGQVVLRWGVQRGTTVIPKTAKKERLAENAGLFDFALTEEEMASIDALDKNKRYNDPAVYAESAFKCFCPIYE